METDPQTQHLINLSGPRRNIQPPYMATFVDWMTFTKKCVKGFDDILFEVIHTFKSMHEHRRLKYQYEGVDLAMNGSVTSRGCNMKIELPGQALQFARYSLGFTDQRLCEWFLCRGFKSIRLDGSVDTADKALNPLKAWRYSERGNVSCESSLRDFRVPKKREGETGVFPKNGVGMTTYFGSSKSDRFLRIYDKRTEMMMKTGEIATDNEGNELNHLTRIELQNRRKRANAMAEAIARHGVSVIPEVIGDYVKFLDPCDKREKKRKNIAKWWLRIIGDKRRALSVPHVVSSPDQTLRWIKKQVAPTLRLMRDMAPENWKQLMESWIADYEVPAKKERTWATWAHIRAERQALIEDLSRIQWEDDALGRIEKQITADSPSEAEGDIGEVA